MKVKELLTYLKNHSLEDEVIVHLKYILPTTATITLEQSSPISGIVGFPGVVRLEAFSELLKKANNVGNDFLMLEIVKDV